MAKRSVKSTKSKASTQTEKKVNDIMDEFRPHSGIRYDLSQTEANLDAGVTKVKLKHTTVEYEPGQDLTKPESKKIRYAKARSRGPVWVFREEIEAKRIELRSLEVARGALMKIRKQRRSAVKFEKKYHKKMMEIIGPKWFHELSPLQKQNADTLKQATLQDKKYGTIQNTMDRLIGIGLVWLPNHTKVAYCIKHYSKCPIEFLMQLYRLTKSEDSEKKHNYTLNEKIILSCVTHLAMRRTLLELHLRLPSPPRTKVVKKRRRHTYEIELMKQRKMTFKSPYTKPNIFIPQIPQHTGVYMNRHKEYASSEYFDYVDDMYDISYEEVLKDPMKNTKCRHPSKYGKPPKIPVRQIQSKITRRKICKLKKPSEYISPCEIILIPEPVKEPSEEPDDICHCSTEPNNKEASFDLNIKITTSNEVMSFTQKLCPYDPQCSVGELQLIEHKIIDEAEDQPRPSSGFKRIEYSCECCICKKPVNIISADANSISLSNSCDVKKIIFDNNKNNEERPSIRVEPRQNKDTDPCKCPSEPFEPDLFANLDDPYFKCTCKPSDDCTCCICKDDQDFLLKLKRYNEIYNTNHKPCFCACKCKKNKTNPCCDEIIGQNCKYCFCKKFKQIEKEQFDALEVVIPEKVQETESAVDETDKTNSATFDRKYSKTIKSELEVDDESLCEECKCEQLYNTFMRSHESCVDLYKDFQEKIKLDVEEYLKDIAENKCDCGDSASVSNEEEGEGASEQYVIVGGEEAGGEDDTNDECCCIKILGQNPATDSSDESDDGCTCGDDEFGRTCACGGICGNTLGLNECQCPKNEAPVYICGHPQYEQSQESTEEIEEIEIAASKKLDSSGEIDKPVKDKKDTKSVQLPTKTGSTTSSEEDPRIINLKKLPIKPKARSKLLKQMLSSLAEDGYPLAQLPDVHKLPIFQLWLDKRTGIFVSMSDRDKLYELSKLSWNHVFKCNRTVDVPKMKWSSIQLNNLNWAKGPEYKRYVYDLRTDFNRRLKQAYISETQEMFPSCYTYKLPTKSFPHCYFAYLTADENHTFVFKPWQIHEVKDMSKRCPC